ncbi:unnamed protein product [Schistosoma mattheei]|uniref:Uncharacterized protein n=1 Tax=Schistosoma mattheei TaxID=31246 RepID=A0AA85BUG4_9TREM|nr:unnamed protein product [Schistosoma mattheei]
MNNSTKVSQKSYDSLQSSSSSLSNKPKLSQKEINKIIERLTKYDETIGPPESNNAKIYLGYGRYEYPHRKNINKVFKHLTRTEIDNLIERLTNEKLPNLSSTNSFTNSISYMKCNANKLQEIIEHLTSDNLSKLPIESTLARKYLDFNRYDYGCSLKSQIRPIMKKLTKKEIHHVIERLTQYDINKYPPESNGHMIKK